MKVRYKNQFLYFVLLNAGQQIERQWKTVFFHDVHSVFGAPGAPNF